MILCYPKPDSHDLLQTTSKRHSNFQSVIVELKGKQPFGYRTIEKETGFSHMLHIPFHRSLAEAIRLHHPDKPEGDAMDTR
jgi:hypothetical protein